MASASFARESAHIEWRSALSRIMQINCNPKLYEEYVMLSSEAQGMLLSLLDKLITIICVDALAEQVQKKIKNPKSRTKRTIRKNTCPIISFLRTYWAPDAAITLCANSSFLSELKKILFEWGSSREITERDIFFHELHAEMHYDKMKMIESLFFVRTPSMIFENQSTGVSWSSLTPINISQLRLFETMKGCKLICTTITTPDVDEDITIFLCDDLGSKISLSLNNYTPNARSPLETAEYARRHLPVGTRVAIAEPITIMYLFGQREILVQNPNEFCIISENVPRSINVSAIRVEGNALVRSNNHQAAYDTYIEGLHDTTDSIASIVSTLLSKRARSYIQLQNWGQALGDAAASLCIRPSCKKTWKRYNRAVEQLKNTNNDAIQHALTPTTWTIGPCKVSKVLNLTIVSEIKSVANSYYQNQQYQEAIDKYTEAILQLGDDIRALLSNWSLCALNIGAIHDAVAASAASLRICSEEKAVYRLCNGLAQLQEPVIALSILKEFNQLPSQIMKGKTREIQCLDELIESVEMAEGITLNDSILSNSRDFVSRNIPITPDWVSSKIESYISQSKGRGIRAVNEIGAKIKKHEVILIEKPLVCARVGLSEGRHIRNSNSGGTFTQSSQVLAKSILVQRCCRDQLLSRRLNLLHDGRKVGSEPLCSIHDMTSKLSDVQPLLPSHSNYMTEPHVNISHDRVDDILSINSFGSKISDQENVWIKKPKVADIGQTTSLYSAISMFNHSKNENCFLYKLESGSTAIITKRRISAGEELTLCYTLNDTALKKWGIQKS